MLEDSDFYEWQIAWRNKPRMRNRWLPLAGLTALSLGGLAAICRVSHGSTVATNAILERKGAPTALITTQGFRDLLAIGRQDRPRLYDLQPRLPPALIPRRWCYEVPERLDPTGLC